MPILTILPAGITARVAEGSTVLDGLLAAGAGIQPKCGGKAQCASCHIFVHDGRKTLSKIQRDEHERLDQVRWRRPEVRAWPARHGSARKTLRSEVLSFSSGF